MIVLSVSDHRTPGRKLLTIGLTEDDVQRLRAGLFLKIPYTDLTQFGEHEEIAFLHGDSHDDVVKIVQSAGGNVQL